jgi:hypothetical protein
MTAPERRERVTVRVPSRSLNPRSFSPYDGRVKNRSGYSKFVAAAITAAIGDLLWWPSTGPTTATACPCQRVFQPDFETAPGSTPSISAVGA